VWLDVGGVTPRVQDDHVEGFSAFFQLRAERPDGIHVAQVHRQHFHFLGF